MKVQLNNKNILLINYSFPPYPGVGGRRWAKIAKYMAKEGNRIYVVNAVNFDSTNSIFESDSKEVKINIHSVSNFKEYIVAKFNNRFFRTFIERVMKLIEKIFFRGNVFDQSLWWAKSAYKKAQKLIQEHKIDTVIISCPPYYSMYYLSRLKLHFPTINLVLDYRDIWTIGQNGKGFFSFLTTKRFAAESNSEHIALSRADLIVTVSDTMTHKIKEKFTEKKVCTISNGFDPMDFTQKNEDFSKFTSKDKINILYAGSLVEDSNVYAILFFKSIADIRDLDIEFYKRLNIKIFGHLNTDIQKWIVKLNLSDVLSVHPAVSSQQIGALCGQFDYLLMFLIPYYKYAFISKAYDYMAARRPIIAVTESGDFSEFLEANQLGFQIDPTDMKENWYYLIKEASYNFNPDFNIDMFSYEKLSHKYLEVLNQIGIK